MQAQRSDEPAQAVKKKKTATPAAAPVGFICDYASVSW
jgi:hypothetical protein